MSDKTDLSTEELKRREADAPLTAQEAVPVAARWGFDGYGWEHYLDNGSGSDWLKRATQHDDVELLYTHPPQSSEAVAEALEIANRVFQFNLNSMIVWGDDYNQAVKDAADAVATALRALKGADNG